jgi:hypothetical protein
MRRALSVSTDGTTVTMAIPHLYNSDRSKNPPVITHVMGWPTKKHHHHKHKNIIVDQIVDYGSPATQTVKYYRSGSNFIREVDGVQNAIATNVADFNLSVNDLDETSYMQLTFTPLFRTRADTDAIQGTKYFQVALFRNTR